VGEREWEREGRRGRERYVVVVGKEGRESERDWCVADRERKSLRRFACVRKCRCFVCGCVCVCLSMRVCLCP